jgi:hypothetical protein
LEDLPTFEINKNSFINRKSQVNNLKKYLADGDENADIAKILLDPKRVLEILNDKIKNTNTLKMHFGTIVKIINNWYKLKIPISIEKEYMSKWKGAKAQSFEDTKTRNETEKILFYSEYLEMTKKFPKRLRKMRVFALLYNEIPVRDNFQLIIVNKLSEITDSKNYLYLPVKGNIRIFVNHSKTAKNYKNTDGWELSPNLTNTLKMWMKDNNLTINDYLFGEKLLGDEIISANRSIGVDGGIQLMRRMKIKDINLLSIPDKVRWSEIMQHDFKTQQTHYLSTA